jgi:hypothetical protein
MLRWVLFVVGIVVLSAAGVFIAPMLTVGPSDGSLSFPANRPKGPSGLARVESDPTHDFGVMGQYSIGKHTWKIKNVGEGELILTGGHPDCSCTLLNLKPGEAVTLKPGDTYGLDVEWQTKSFSGPFEKKASIFVRNDPKREEVRLVVKGRIEPAVVVYPEDRSVDFGEIASIETKTRSVLVSSPDRPETKILSVTTNRPEFLKLSSTAESEKELQSVNLKTGYRIDIETIPTKKLGLFTADVIIKTDNEKAPEVRILVNGKFAGPVSAIPEIVRWTGVPGDSGATVAAIITVRDQESTHFEIVSAPEPLSITVEPVESKPTPGRPRQYRMVATIPPGAEASVVTGAVTLKTDHPEVGEFKIPVQIMIQDGN